MADKDKNLQWLGKPIKAPEHARDLERKSAIYEFDHKMSRNDAESRAYKEYLGDQHAEAAAHHLVGMKISKAFGWHEDSHKHHDMYSLHIRALGKSPNDPVPPEVASYVTAAGSSKKGYRFKNHPADQLLVSNK